MKAKIKVKPCPFCGRQIVFHRDEHVKKYGKEVVEQYYMHEEKEAECILDELCMPLVIGAGDATDDYGKYEPYETPFCPHCGAMMDGKDEKIDKTKS